MPAEAIERFERRFDVTIVEGYGLSETTTASTINPLRGRRKPGTVGLPCPGSGGRRRRKRGESVPAGERGEVVIAGPVVMAGYLGRTGRDGPDHRRRDGCTPATSGASTRTATCRSSTGSRT